MCRKSHRNTVQYRNKSKINTRKVQNCTEQMAMSG